MVKKTPESSQAQELRNTKNEMGEWSCELLRWVVRQRQRGCEIFAIHQQAQICEKLDFPFLAHVDSHVSTSGLSDYPLILGNEVQRLIGEGRVEEAEEVIQVMKILSKTTKPLPSEQSTKAPSVSSSMTLEAAKILAEEGDPESAMTLVEQTRRESSSEDTAESVSVSRDK